MTYVARTGPWIANLGSFATLAELSATHAPNLYDPGTHAYCALEGPAYTNGIVWLTINAGAVVVVSLSASLAAGPLNDLGAGAIPGYVSGSTNRLILTAAAGGTTINGLDASGVADGFAILIQNPSATDSLIFAHLAAGSFAANRFSNMAGSSVTIPSLGAARCTYVVNKWQFA